MLVKNKRFYRLAALLRQRRQILCIKACAQGLRPQRFVTLNIGIMVSHQIQRTKGTDIREPHRHAVAERKFNFGIARRRRLRLLRNQSTRHTQMHNQLLLRRRLQHQILAPAPHAANRFANQPFHKLLRAGIFNQAVQPNLNRQNLLSLYMRSKSFTYLLDLRHFRH